jgi:putative colanic acid biosynthesis acetyltransferase WcaF
MKLHNYYTKKELFYRLLWFFVYPVFFRYSPRLIYSWRNFILRLLGAKIGKGVKIYPSAKITYPWLLELGDNVVIAWNVDIYNLGYIKIGEKTVISQNAHLCAGTHNYQSKKFELIRSKIEIGNNVWIAADAFVGPNVVIGDYSILSSRTVLMKSIESHSVYAGNPAQFIKKCRETWQ